MTKKVRYRSKRAAIHARMVEIERTWTLATQRGRQPLRQIKAIFEAVFGSGSLLLNRDDLILQHRRDNTLSLDTAASEVAWHHAKIVNDLRDNGMPLLHPVTEYGYTDADRVDGSIPGDVARCVPGVGRGGKTFGWRMAHGTDDVVLAAYIQHRWHSGERATEKAYRLRTEAAKAGVLPAAPTLPKVPKKIA